MASSGLHSNGYSLVRHVLLNTAGMSLTAHVDDLGRTLGEELLEPTRIGVELSEEFQLHPEQSTSALIVHHPEAKYFNAT